MYTYDLHRDGFTQSMLGTFMTCPKKCQFRYLDGLKAERVSGAGALEFGDIFHRALDALYSLVKGEKPLDHVIDDAIDLIHNQDKEYLQGVPTAPDAFEKLETTTGMARVTLQNYMRWWFADFQELDWISLEEIFETKYADIPIRGKFDGVFRDKNGRLWLFETKTKGIIDIPTLGDFLEYDFQTHLYMWALRRIFNEEPCGVVYNLVKRPALRQKQTEDLPAFLERIDADIQAEPTKYFSRYSHTNAPGELNNWQQNDLDQVIAEVMTMVNLGVAFRNSGACYQWQRPCEYMNLCAHGSMLGLVEREVPFTELMPIDTETGED